MWADRQEWRLVAFSKALCIKRVDDRPFTGSTPEAIDAIMVAPWPLGVRNLRRPTPHQQVWQAIQDAHL